MEAIAKRLRSETGVAIDLMPADLTAADGLGLVEARLCQAGNEHVLIVGSSRSGKGTGNTLLDWPHSVICYDEKAELHRLTSSWGAGEANNRVLRFEPASPGNSCQFNFLDTIRLGTEHETGDAMNIAAVLAEDGARPSGDAVHWHETVKGAARRGDPLCVSPRASDREGRIIGGRRPRT